MIISRYFVQPWCAQFLLCILLSCHHTTTSCRPATAEQADLREMYLAPALKLNQQQLQPLLDEAADVEQRLRALGL